MDDLITIIHLAFVLVPLVLVLYFFGGFIGTLYGIILIVVIITS